MEQIVALNTLYESVGKEVVPYVVMNERKYYVYGGKDINGKWHDLLKSDVTGKEKYIERNALAGVVNEKKEVEEVVVKEKIEQKKLF